MTREEAIKILESIIPCGEFDFFAEEKEALKIALQALKQPDIIRCRDCSFCVTMPPNYTWCENHQVFVEPGDFCSYGCEAENRSEEGDDNAD